MCNTFTLQVFLLYIPQKHLMSTLFHVIVYDNQTKYKTPCFLKVEVSFT